VLPEPITIPPLEDNARTDFATDEADFLLADGTTLPFAEWIPGLLPLDRIRNQLTAIDNMCGTSGKPEDLAIAVLTQQLVVVVAGQLNRLTAAGLAQELVDGLPEQFEAACRQVKNILDQSLDEVACWLGGVLKTENMRAAAV
jgi:hypothetical protein